jgi:hypothetical protein
MVEKTRTNRRRTPIVKPTPVGSGSVDVKQIDHSQSNPGLHLLYVKWAIEHLHRVLKDIDFYLKKSNWNWNQTGFALIEDYKRIVKEDKAYEDAHEVLMLMKLVKYAGLHKITETMKEAVEAPIV